MSSCELFNFIDHHKSCFCSRTLVLLFYIVALAPSHLRGRTLVLLFYYAACVCFIRHKRLSSFVTGAGSIVIARHGQSPAHCSCLPSRSFYTYTFCSGRMALVIAPRLHPLLSKTALQFVECHLRRGGSTPNRLMSFCNNWWKERVSVRRETLTSLHSSILEIFIPLRILCVLEVQFSLLASPCRCVSVV